MSANETVPILASKINGTENEGLSALSGDNRDAILPLLPEVAFESALDSPGLNRESQPLLGGLDVSYNQFPGSLTFVYFKTQFNYIYT